MTNPNAPPQTLPQAAPALVTRPRYAFTALLYGGMAGTLAGVTGCGSHLIRPLFPGNIHFDAIAALGVCILLSIVLLARFLFFPFLPGLLSMLTGLGAVWLGMALGWIAAFAANFFGWQLDEFFLWDDILGVALAWWAGTFVVGAILLGIKLLLRQLIAPPVARQP